MRKTRLLSALAALLCATTTAWAQTPPADEPGWAKGRPKANSDAMQMAPVPAFPIPTAPDKLPTAKFKLPPGFKVETWLPGVLDARERRHGAEGTVFVSTLFVANKVYAVVDKGGKRELKTIIDRNLASLTNVEETVIRRRFNWQEQSESPLTLEEVGKIIGVTKERVRQIQNKALAKIKLVMEDGVLRTTRTGESTEEGAEAQTPAPIPATDLKTA